MNMEPQIGELAQVNLGGFEVEGFRTVSNKYALCIGDASLILSLSIDQFRQKARRLLKNGYSEFELRYECNGWPATVDVIPLSVFSSFAYRLSKENYKPALNLLESLFPELGISEIDGRASKPKIRKEKERVVQQRLARAEGGRMEVYCPAGIIDIVTAAEIIEVKEASGWKSAVGQVLAYGQYYPQLGKRIHIFSDMPPQTKEIVVSHCETFGIAVTFED